MAPSTGAGGAVVKLLQTAASLENLATTVYDAAVNVAVDTAVADVFTRAAAMHTERSRAFNDAVVQAGGKAQDGPNPKYAAAVRSTLAGLKTVLDAVKLAATVEDVTVQTYVKNVVTVPTPQLRELFAGAAGAGAQQLAVLLVVQHLTAAGLPYRTDAAKLPGPALAAGVPHALFPVDRASPADEGAL